MKKIIIVGAACFLFGAVCGLANVLGNRKIEKNCENGYHEWGKWEDVKGDWSLSTQVKHCVKCNISDRR